MRFVFAILCFVIAAVMIGFGIAQRTILAEPDQVVLATNVSTGTAVTVIDGATLNAFNGSQTLTLRGSGEIFAAYGRTSDIIGWIGDAKYTKVSIDPVTEQLTSTVVPGTQKTVPKPAGSDLWLAEYDKTSSLELTVKVPDNISFIIVSDGTKPAPPSVELSWPLDNSTPWAGPLVIAGSIVLIVGLGLLLWAINHMRSGRGPRRKPQKMPKVPRKRVLAPAGRKALPAPETGRRRAFIAAPLLLISALALSGCTGVHPNPVGPSPSSTSSDIPVDSGLEPPAVTVRQVERIVSDIREVGIKADAARDSALIATRFDSAALQLRLANYAIRGTDPAVTALPAIPTGPVTLTLPQQTSTWPRTVLAVIQEEKDATVPPVALFLVQPDARSDYKVSYLITLEPAAKLPEVAPANVGTSRLAVDSGVLKKTPKDAALAYGDILQQNVDSSSYLDFEATGDTLRAAVGLTYKNSVRAALPPTARVVFGFGIGPADEIALATNDAGGLVAVNLNETTTVTPVEAGAAVNPTGEVKALSNIAVSTKGVVATYGYQLLFYIPAAGTNAKIVLLGYSQGLVAASEVG